MHEVVDSFPHGKLHGMQSAADATASASGTTSSNDSDSHASTPRGARAIVWALFLLSGACGLIYEVLWCRQLGLIFGNTVHSLSAVLTAFMGGLALGSFVAGRLCHRLRRPLLVYGVLEVLIGVYCAALPWVLSDSGPLVPMYRSLYGEAGSSSLVVARFGISFVLLLIPTTFMGATLPVLSHFLVRSGQGLGRTVGALYAINTFGAVVGAASTGFILLPELGKINTNWAAVACNLLLGALAIAYGKNAIVESAAVAEASTPSENQSSHQASVSPAALKAVVIAFGITGFAAMATQIGWTRAISLGTGSSTYAFSLIVSVFIMGLSLGGAWASRIAPRVEDPVVLLGKILLLIGLLGMVLAALLGYGPVLFYFLLAWGSDAKSGELNWGFLLFIQALGISALIIIPTFLMGATMPLTLQCASRSSTDTGKTVGTIYAVNTVGAILGSFLGGLLLIPALQIQRTLELMAILYALPGLLLISLSPSRKLRVTSYTTSAIALPLAVIVLMSPRWEPRIMSAGLFLLRDSERVKAARAFQFDSGMPNLNRTVLWYREGAAATVAIAKSGETISLSVGGKPDASSHGDLSTQMGLTLVPELLHPTGAQEVLVIGLGSGISVAAGLAPESVSAVDVVEMSPEVVEASSFFEPFSGLPYTKQSPITINHPKVRVLINDGRNHLLLSSKKYDVISSEPSNPWMAGIGNLFTKEAFELSKQRLKPGGIMCQWVHSYSLEDSHFMSIVRTFGEAFPHIQLWWINRGDYLLLGSEAPMTIPLATLRQRFAEPKIREWLTRVNFDRECEFLAGFLSHDASLKGRAAKFALHTDDNMLLEFSAPRALYSRTKTFRSINFIPYPERIVVFDQINLQDRVDFLRDLDLAVGAREHLRYALENVGPQAAHFTRTKELAPYQVWAQTTFHNDKKNEPATPVASKPIPPAVVEQLRQGNVSAALGEFHRRFGDEPSNPEALAEFIDALLLTADVQDRDERQLALNANYSARRYSQQLVHWQPDSPRAWQLLIRALLDLWKREKEKRDVIALQITEAYAQLKKVCGDAVKIPAEISEAVEKLK
jgi:spermidine synthase